jgi:hypothetical protein
MKKMNLNLGRIGRMLLPVFFLMGLFLFNVNSVQAQNAQAPGDFSVKVLKHINSLPSTDAINLPIKKSSQEEINNPRKANDLKIGLEKEYGNLIVYGITRKGFEDKEAIEKTYELLIVKIPAEYLDPVKQVYLDLLGN